jgi:hypothetical protein
VSLVAFLPRAHEHEDAGLLHGEHLSFNVAILTLGLIGALAARELDLRGRLAFVQRRIIREQVAELDAERTRSEDSIQVSEARRYDDIPPRAPPAARLRASRFSAARANVSERD